MAKNLPTRRIEQTRYLNFKKVAESFKEAGQMAFEFGYFNAAGVLVIHSAIAFADAITIKLSSQKMKGDSHYDVIALLSEVVPPEKKNEKALSHFNKLIDHKNLVSYSGDVYRKSDVEKLMKNFERFISWAKSLLD